MQEFTNVDLTTHKPISKIDPSPKGLTIRGNVRSTQDHGALEGVEITFVGRSETDVSDRVGNFKIVFREVPERLRLRANLKGFKVWEKEIPVGGKQAIIVQLEPE